MGAALADDSRACTGGSRVLPARTTSGLAAQLQVDGTLADPEAPLFFMMGPNGQ